MSRFRLLLRTSPVLVALVVISTRGIAQATGFVHLYTHTSDSTRDMGVYRTFEQGSNGLVETFTSEFTPGQHTLARVEALNNSCRASADNVTFNVTAGKWTEVDVPVTYKDCLTNISIIEQGGRQSGGTGTVEYYVAGSNGTIPVANCQTVYGPAGYSWPNFHSCFGVAPYGTVVTDTETAGPNSCCSGQSSFVANLDILNYTGVTAFESSGAAPPLVSAVADVEIRLVSGSFGGYVGSSTFRVVNHGPHNAYGVVVSSVRDLTDNNESGNYSETISIADGFCYDYRCHLSVLPIGDSTTFTVRWEASPEVPGDTSAANLPSETLTCATATVTNESSNHDTLTADPNLSNNTASCMRGVPVTVALGGSTPPSRTVASGSSNVPMLEFLLTPTSQQSVTGVTVQASGSGNELLDVTAVHLYVDKNGNGSVDVGDSVVASGTFAANDGSVTLAVNPGLAITAPTALLVTYSFALTIAERLGGGLVLAMLPLFFIPGVRRRKSVTVMLMILLTTVAVACGGDSSTGPKPQGSVTFQSTLTGVTTTNGSFANLALSGGTITVNK